MNLMAIKSALSQTDMGLLLLLGTICALFGILMMRAVTLVERICGRIALPRALQPAIGGIIVGLFALVTPHVLASGHGALFRRQGLATASSRSMR
jgi:CIC family chloride channel protein